MWGVAGSAAAACRGWQEAAGRALHCAPLLQEFAAADQLAQGILSGCRRSISRGITLVESSRLDHQLQAARLLRQLQHHLAQQQQRQQLQHRQPGAHDLSSTPTSIQQGSTGLGRSGPRGAADSSSTATPGWHCGPQAFRIGVSGPPGAGKSSLIEALGCRLADAGERVAVLAVDPSSQASGGAILGDKTRMPRLSSRAQAYVRPSPARGTLGGVARATFDAILICEAAGFSQVLIETVGVGQSETAVQDLADVFLLVLPPAGGDELQVIKRGVTELADIVVINKADGSTQAAAARAAAAFGSTLRLHHPRWRSWQPRVLTCSAHTGLGLDKLQAALGDYHSRLSESGELAALRCEQRRRVAWAAAEEAVLDSFRQDPAVRSLLSRLGPDIASGELAPRAAAEFLQAYHAMYD